jgi:hypothetical protein
MNKPSDSNLIMAAIVLRACPDEAGAAAQREMNVVADWLESQRENKEYEHYNKATDFWRRASP